MAYEEERDMKGIERFIGRSIVRVTIPDFDYKKAPSPEDRGGRGHGASGGREGGRDGGRDGAGRGTPSPRPAAGPAADASGPMHGRRPKRDSPGARKRR
jgi:hypothetical protein